MTGFIVAGSNLGDAITGERVLPGERVFDTGLSHKGSPWMGRGRTRVIKEDTIVWLAEQAGYVVTKRDAGDSRNAKVVDGEDVGVGVGEIEVGEAEVGGGDAPKRRSSRKTKGE